MAFRGLFVKGQGRILNSLETFLIYTHIPNFKGLRQIVFVTERAEENLCGGGGSSGGGGVTGLNPKYLWGYNKQSLFHFILTELKTDKTIVKSYSSDMQIS